MISQDMLIVWLEKIHSESIEKAEKAGNYLMEGIALGKVNLSYMLIQEIKKGAFMAEVKPVEYSLDFSNHVKESNYKYELPNPVYDFNERDEIK